MPSFLAPLFGFITDRGGSRVRYWTIVVALLWLRSRQASAGGEKAAPPTEAAAAAPELAAAKTEPNLLDMLGSWAKSWAKGLGLGEDAAQKTRSRKPAAVV